MLRRQLYCSGRLSYLIPMDEKTREILLHPTKGTILINLDGNAEYNATSLKDFQLACKRGEKYIITPLTHAIDNWFCFQGYRVIIESEGRHRCLNEMLLGNIKPNERELRVAHNAEKLFMSGAYEDIETRW